MYDKDQVVFAKQMSDWFLKQTLSYNNKCEFDETTKDKMQEKFEENKKAFMKKKKEIINYHKLS